MSTETQKLEKALERERQREENLGRSLRELPHDADPADAQFFNDELRLTRAKIASGERRLETLRTEEQVAREKEEAEQKRGALEVYEQMEADGRSAQATPELRSAALAERERRGLERLLRR